MIVGKVRSYPSDAPFIYSILGSAPAFPANIRLGRKHGTSSGAPSRLGSWPQPQILDQGEVACPEQTL